MDSSSDNNDYDPTAHYDLNDEQVEALIAAIESSPMSSPDKNNNNEDTSEVVIKAALYLTGDEPQKREQEFIDALAAVQDASSVQKELISFEKISADFANSTTKVTAPEVLQTRYRLDRIVSSLEEWIKVANESQRKSSLRNSVKKPAKTALGANVDGDAAADNSASEINKDNNTSMFESNWFKFAAFSVVALLIVIAIVIIVQWLRTKTEEKQDSSAATLTTSDKQSVVDIL